MDASAPAPTALLPAPTEAGLAALLLHLEVVTALLFHDPAAPARVPSRDQAA